MSTTFSWMVATPEGSVASGECEFLVVPTAGGELGVLADHAALVAIVVPGDLRVTGAQQASGGAQSASPKADSASGGAVLTVSVGAGVVEVRDNHVRLLVTRAAGSVSGADRRGTAPG